MTDFLIEAFHKYRFLLVAVLVMIVLYGPLTSEAFQRKKENTLLKVTEVNSSMAGLGNTAFILADPDTEFSLLLTKPSGNTVALSGVTDKSGGAEIAIESKFLQEAGIYNLQGKTSSTNYGAKARFEVYPGTTSTSVSQIEWSSITPEVGEDLVLSVWIRDDFGNPLEGHVVKVTPSDASIQATPDWYSTNEEGQMDFHLTSYEAQTLNFTITDVSSKKTLDVKPSVAFSGLTSDFDMDFALQDMVQLSSASGPVSAFRISGLNTEVEAGKEFSFTVTAVDAEGLDVSDYTGSVQFSTTDSKATLPNDYTFTAEDLGQHQFTLAVKFLTPGDQILSVRDSSVSSLKGSSTTTVLPVGSSTQAYDSDFVTTTAEDKGDFELISPASGTYSSGSVEVQGSGDYGKHAIVYVNDEEVGRVEIDFDNSFSYTLKDMTDGDYKIRTDIVELGTGDPGKESIAKVLKTSSVEDVKIDTSAPDLISVSSDPEKNIAPESTVLITVLSESGMKEAAVLLLGVIYPLEESSTSGKYQSSLLMPKEAGDYSLDIVLNDELGNKVQYRDQLTLKVGAGEVASASPSEADLSKSGQTDGSLKSVTGLTTVPGTEHVTLSWDAAESLNEVAYYRVYYGPSEESMYAISDTLDSSTTWVIDDLLGEEVYYFAVSAVDKTGQEGPKSTSMLGIPKKNMELERPNPSDLDPALSHGKLPPNSPQSGPATNLLILLSFLGSALYFGVKKTRALAKF